MQPMYPHITVKLAGLDGNALTIVSRVKRAMQVAGVPADEISAFIAEATSGDYDHLLTTVMRYVDVD